jgi:hypothetical protein
VTTAPSRVSSSSERSLIVWIPSFGVLHNKNG